MTIAQKSQIEQVLQHSKKVRMARISLPIGAFFLLLLLFWIPKFIDGGQLSAKMIMQNNQAILKSNRPVLSEPRYQGSSNGWVYDISAYVANNVYEETARVDLISPEGIVNADTGESFTSKANAGSWFANEQILELTGNASLFYSLGYFVETEQAQINVTKQEVRTPGNAWGEAEFGYFKSEKMRIEDNGNIIWLLGKSHVTIIAEKSPKNILEPTVQKTTPAETLKAIKDK